MFGFKMKTVKTKNAYSIESLFEAIRAHSFSAGIPELTKHGMNNVITVPALDMNNQVWIMVGQMTNQKECTKWTVLKSKKAGVANTAMNMALDSVTDGWSSFSGVFGKKAKEAERLTELTAKELDALGL